MLVSFALGNANGFASQWNIGLRDSYLGFSYGNALVACIKRASVHFSQINKVNSDDAWG